MEMGRLSFRIAGIAYRSDDAVMGYERQSMGSDLVQMRVIMEPPLRSEHHDKIPAQAVLSFGDDYSYGSRRHVGSLFCTNVDALMGDGFSPGISPERMLIVVAAGGILNGHHEVLGDDQAGY